MEHGPLSSRLSCESSMSVIENPEEKKLMYLTYLGLKNMDSTKLSVAPNWIHIKPNFSYIHLLKGEIRRENQTNSWH